jgi:putative transposase
MPYSQLLYHLVWSTQHQRPLLTAAVEPVIHGYLRHNAAMLGATVFALDGTADHVHLVVTIPPKIAVARFVGQVKALASWRFNQGRGETREPFFWQQAYGALTLDRERLAEYVDYVERQKEHHHAKTLIPTLEWIHERQPAADGQGVMREPPPGYVFEQTDWLERVEG